MKLRLSEECGIYTKFYVLHMALLQRICKASNSGYKGMRILL